MRRNIITSAILLGALSAQAGSYSFAAKPHKIELSNGTQIEILLQQELPDEDDHFHQDNLQAKLSRSVLSHEKMLQILNKVRKEEQEVNEELSL